MFSGIIESTSKIIGINPGNKSIQIIVSQPSEFDDLEVGASIALNGVCLTVEKFNGSEIQFTVGFETMTLLGWSSENLKNRTVNLERSLKFGDRVHGHLVTGHVDALAEVIKAEFQGDCLIVGLKIPSTHTPYIWKKGSVTINGVSLTVNNISGDKMEICLIPETLRRTNLVDLKVSDLVNIETDYLAKCFLQAKGMVTS